MVGIGWLAIWAVAFAVLIKSNSRQKGPAGFLTYAYVIGFAISHWFGGLVHALPWKEFLDSTNTVLGFTESTYALVFFVLGAMLIRAQSRVPQSPPASSPELRQNDHVLTGHRIAWIYLNIGAAAWLLSYTGAAAVPSFGAVISAGKQMVLVGICLKCWLAWHYSRPLFVRWMALALIFPFITVIFQGFLGYGIAAIIIILSFGGMFYKPRWHIAAGGLAAIYAGLSLWVAYLDHRDNIRAVVWGGESFDARVNTVTDMLQAIKPYDFGDPHHLWAIDIRLNQNELVGAAVNYTPSVRDFAHGETIYYALVALVPRIIWPSKPVTAGSMGLVSEYTGIQFAEGTSVGLGQVLEFYINFGRPGVIIGFFLLGLFIRYADVRLARCLVTGDWQGFGLWFLVGVSALQSGGSLLEITSTMAASAIAALLIARFAAVTKSSAAVCGPTGKVA